MSLLDRLRHFTKKPTALVAARVSALTKSATNVVVNSETAKPEQQVQKARQSNDHRKISSSIRTDILRRPIITEKATLTETYIFEVHPTATKGAVRDAIHATYGVIPQHVRMMNVQGKKVRWAGRIGQRVSWKKAIVRLPKGKTISVYEGT